MATTCTIAARSIAAVVAWNIQMKSTIRLVCTPRRSEKQCFVETSLADWNRWRHLLIAVHLSVQRGNVEKHIQDITKKPKVAEHEFQNMDPDDEAYETSSSDSQLFVVPTVSASQIMNI